MPLQAVVFVEGNAVGVFGCGIGEGALHLFCDFGAFDDDAHFGIEPCGTGSRLNEPMKMRLPSTMKVLACRLVTELPVSTLSLWRGRHGWVAARRV